MNYSKVKSYAKINIALNITGKSFMLHKIESIISFLDLYDLILIKKSHNKNHLVKFSGRFSKNVKKNNTVSKLLSILDKKKILKGIKFEINVKKNIPTESGLGGGSMNAANILRFLIKRNMISVSNKEITEISGLIGSDVILGMYSKNLVLTSDSKIKNFSKVKKIHTLIVKPNFGCSTSKIYAGVKKYKKSQFNYPTKKMFNLQFLQRMNNDLELIAFKKYPKLYTLKIFLQKLSDVKFVRMTGSGSALIAYFSSNRLCKEAEKKVRKKFKNYWCKTAKTI